MVNWQTHSGFDSDCKRLRKTIKALDSSLKQAKRLLEAHFYDESTRGKVIGPGKIHRVSIVSDKVNAELWKLEVSVTGLKPNLWPRMWFVLDGGNIFLLAIDSHKNNYDNNRMDEIAKERFSEMIGS